MGRFSPFYPVHRAKQQSPRRNILFRRLRGAMCGCIIIYVSALHIPAGADEIQKQLPAVYHRTAENANFTRRQPLTGPNVGRGLVPRRQKYGRKMRKFSSPSSSSARRGMARSSFSRRNSGGTDEGWYTPAGGSQLAKKSRCQMSGRWFMPGHPPLWFVCPRSSGADSPGPPAGCPDRRTAPAPPPRGHRPRCRPRP